MGDFFFHCPTFSISEELSGAGNPVYTYRMTHVPGTSMWGKNLTWLGATHAEDIPYVFGSPFMLESADPDENYQLIGHFNEDEIEMSKQVMKYWSNFAKTGYVRSTSTENIAYVQDLMSVSDNGMTLCKIIS